MNNSKKISKQGLKDVIKQAILETGGDVERAKIISETVIGKLDEIGYRGASLASGANYNANNQLSKNANIIKNQQKYDKSHKTILPALNQSIKGNFADLKLLFYMEKMGGISGCTISFLFDEVSYIDFNRVVLKGNITESTNYEPNSRNGSIEYNFKTGTFYEVKFYGQGSIRRTNAMRIDTNSPGNVKTTQQFLTFISNYLYSVEDYQTNINKQNNT